MPFLLLNHAVTGENRSYNQVFIPGKNKQKDISKLEIATKIITLGKNFEKESQNQRFPRN